MVVKSIAFCYRLWLRPLFCLLLSGRFRQVLTFLKKESSHHHSWPALITSLLQQNIGCFLIGSIYQRKNCKQLKTYSCTTDQNIFEYSLGLCEGGIGKLVPWDHHLSSLAKPCDSKRVILWTDFTMPLSHS